MTDFAPNFDLDRLHTLLASSPVPEAHVHLLEQVNSTNAILWDWIDQGAPAWTVAIARSQTAGRGQWGRQWHSATGGLYLSVAIAPDLAVDRGAQLTMATGVGIASALRSRLANGRGTIPVQIKWLNDLVVEGKKLGGILTESRVQGGKLVQAVIGVGINWQNPVPTTGVQLQPLMTSMGLQQDVGLEVVAAIVLEGIANGLTLLQQGDTSALTDPYEALLANRGQVVDWQGERWKVMGVAASGWLRVCPERADSEDGTSADGIEKLVEPGTLSLGYI
jgi:BirA family transcriptional regulator, biotin operon repressor / biotin---[acetyl-CoA-carboxylase] ligase